MNEESSLKLRKIIEELRGLEDKCDWIHDELRISEAVLILEKVIE